MPDDKPPTSHDFTSGDDASPEGEKTAPPEGPPENDLRRLHEELEEARKNTERFKDQLLRKAAEFENYRRRTEAEFALVSRSANETLLLSLLPVLDDFDRFLKHGRERSENEGLIRGAELIQAKLARALEQHGLAPFASAGEPFDVDLHDALLQVPRSDVPPGTVVEEIERGYRLFDRVLRHAKVIVSSAPSGSESSAPDPTEDLHGEA